MKTNMLSHYFLMNIHLFTLFSRSKTFIDIEQIFSARLLWRRYNFLLSLLVTRWSKILGNYFFAKSDM